MANVTIPNLTSATTIAPSTDLMVLEQTEGTRKATLSQIFTSSATSGSGLGITSGGVYAIKSGLDSDISDINTLLGNTSIASIGDGTVTGAVSQINSDLTAKNGFYFGDATKHITNALDVNLNDTFDTRNSCGYCTVNDTGVPSDFQSGVREVFRRSNSHVMVRLTGIGTDNTLGIWVNYYLNNTWLGWKRFN